MNDDRRDALSVDDILNEYYAADSARSPQPAEESPLRTPQRRPVTAQPAPQAVPPVRAMAAEQRRAPVQPARAPMQAARTPAPKAPKKAVHTQD